MKKIIQELVTEREKFKIKKERIQAMIDHDMRGPLIRERLGMLLYIPNEKMSLFDLKILRMIDRYLENANCTIFDVSNNTVAVCPKCGSNKITDFELHLGCDERHSVWQTN